MEALNAAVHRMRRARLPADIASALIEAAAGVSGRAALLLVEEKTLVGWRAAGMAGAVAAFRLPLREAPAAAQAVETRAAVVTRAWAELSGQRPDQKACLVPLTLDGRVAAMLYAEGAEIEPAALELLCAAAEASIEALAAAARRPVDPGVTRVSRGAASSPPDPSAWSAAEREMHQRAQRFARLLVADLYLERSVPIQEGRKAGNLYGALRDEIDRSRAAYRRKFANSAAAAVDYLHMELLRTLAGGRKELLGPDYPGPQD